MNAVNFHLRSRVRAWAPLVFAGLALPSIAGEPAKISVPSGPADSSNLARPAEPFQPLDRGSSIGGVVDAPAAPPVGTVEPPNARTQKAIFERLDRQKNWLLDDRTESKKTSSFLLPEAGDESSFGTSQAKPQTALERRLKNGTRTDTTRAAGNAADRESNLTSDPERDPLSRDNTPAGAAGLPAFGSNLEGDRRTSSSRSSALFGSIPEPDLMDELRSSRTTSNRHNTGSGTFGNERMERFQQNFGETDLSRRNPAADAARVDRSRESRVDSFNSLPSITQQTGLAAAGVVSADDTPLTRLGRSDSSRLGSSPNPYAPSAAPVIPSISPAAQLLKAQPVQSPKFRP